MGEQVLIGSGRTADVYTWDSGQVIKLFVADYPKTAVEREFRLAQLLNPLDFPKPKAYEMVLWESRWGIVYEHIIGESLLTWVLRTMNVEQCANRLATLHTFILQNTVAELPSYKEFLHWGISKATSLSPHERNRALQHLNELPDESHLCHGDFHPGNVLIHEEKSVVLDFMNVCRGPILYDIARTVYLVQYTAMPDSNSESAEIKQFRENLANLYIHNMGVLREQLAPYLTVIHWARRGEAPEEGSTYKGCFV